MVLTGLQKGRKDESMKKGIRRKSLYDTYRFEGFTPVEELKGKWGEPRVRIVRLNRRTKKRYADVVGMFKGDGMTRKRDWYETSHAGIIRFIWKWISAGWPVGSVRL